MALIISLLMGALGFAIVVLVFDFLAGIFTSGRSARSVIWETQSKCLLMNSGSYSLITNLGCSVVKDAASVLRASWSTPISFKKASMEPYLSSTLV
jgi:hypothetical protein